MEAKRFSYEFETCSDPVLENMLAETSKFGIDLVKDVNPRWLTFLGKSGTGKTHLSKKLLGIAQKIRNRDARFAVWPDTVSALKKGEWGRVDGLIESEFCFIDEIGADHDPSGSARKTLSQILNGRLGKWTVLTSNLSMEAIEAVDVRIASRIMRGGGVIVECNTTDYNFR